MTKNEILELIDSWENLPLLIKEIAGNPENYGLLIELALYHPGKKSWRAAYLVDRINDDFPELLGPYLNDLVKQLALEKSTGKKRHFLKLISQHPIHEKHFGFLVEYCLATLSSAKEPPAVRVHAMQILFEISETETDLKQELLLVIEHEMEFHATAGILSRGRKLATKLHKQINKS